MYDPKYMIVRINMELEYYKVNESEGEIPFDSINEVLPRVYEKE